MFDRIFDLIEGMWEWLMPFCVIDQYEEGVVLRLGKFHHVVKPGLRWLIPLGIDAVKYDTVVRQTAFLDTQSITSADNKPVTLRGIAVYTITDIRKFLLDIDDGEVDMSNMIYGIITDTVEATEFKNIKGKKFNSNVFENAKIICNSWCGVNLIAIKWSDKTTARTLRLWND